ncbi:MAG: putative toxin-antitoxin system toxin component, PIN family [Candidatus Poribacteria bacterium]|nr:putative toxin-antitoxin system toxin component, PIN family [Candidatus Poribacteria bacterium]
MLSGLGWKGAPYRCIELARRGRIVGLTCSEILAELAEKLTSKFEFSLSQKTEAVTDFLGFMRLVKITNTFKFIDSDVDDNKIIECAVVGSATHIVTGDRRQLLPLRSYQGIQIVTASDRLVQFS